MVEAVAKFNLMGLQSSSNSFSKIDMISFFTNAGISQEVILRVQTLWEETKKMAGQVYAIGKIIIIKLIDFIKDNPAMAIGVAMGVGLGFVASSVPFIGFLIAPLVTAISVTIGAFRGHRIDRLIKGEDVHNSIIDDAFSIAKTFWAFFSDIFETLKQYFEEKN